MKDTDLWNVDLYLAKQIADAVDEYRERTPGYPSDLTPEEWDSILERIIKPFRAYEEADARWDTNVDLDEAWDLLRKWFGALWI